MKAPALSGAVNAPLDVDAFSANQRLAKVAGLLVRYRELLAPRPWVAAACLASPCAAIGQRAQYTFNRRPA